MAKESGIGDRLFVGGYDLSGDVGAVQTIAARRALLDVTDLTQAAPQRLAGLSDGEISFNTWYDPATGASHDALKGLPTTDRTALYFHGTTVGNPAAGLLGKQVNYDWSRGQDGSLAGTVQVLANGSPLDWGIMLTSGAQLFASAGAGTAWDQTTVSTAFGAVAYLQVFGVSGTSVTVAVQDSVDSTPANFSNITGLAFTAVTPGRGEQRLATSTTATIRRWVRINLTGTFTNATVAVVFSRFLVAQG